MRTGEFVRHYRGVAEFKNNFWSFVPSIKPLLHFASNLISEFQIILRALEAEHQNIRLLLLYVSCCGCMTLKLIFFAWIKKDRLLCYDTYGQQDCCAQCFDLDWYSAFHLVYTLCKHFCKFVSRQSVLKAGWASTDALFLIKVILAVYSLLLLGLLL